MVINHSHTTTPQHCYGLLKAMIDSPLTGSLNSRQQVFWKGMVQFSHKLLGLGQLDECLWPELHREPARGLYTWPLLTLLFSMKSTAGIKYHFYSLICHDFNRELQTNLSVEDFEEPQWGQQPHFRDDHPRGGRNAGQAPVEPSQAVLLKEALGHTGKSSRVWFSGNATNICKRFGLLRRGLAQCSVLSVNPPCAGAQSSQQQWSGRAHKATKRQQEPSGPEYSQYTESTIQALKSIEFWKQLQRWKEGWNLNVTLECISK